jgi:hypothetical protein
MQTKRIIKQARKLKAQSSVIYMGPSLIDGAPIMVVAVISKRNRKTGAMLQTYIMRADMDPRRASAFGLDFSICGNCPLRGIANPKGKQAAKRPCYVILGQGPTIVYKSFLKGNYPTISSLDDIASLGENRMVRIGTYGDGAAVPAHIWQALLSKAAGHTAYSHQSGMAQAAFDPAIYMVSADSEAQAQAAWQAGRRTFRVIDTVADIVKGKEILCPASKEAGARTTCFSCGLCGGNSVKGKSIAIPAHGNGASHIKRKAA